MAAVLIWEECNSMSIWAEGEGRRAKGKGVPLCLRLRGLCGRWI